MEEIYLNIDKEEGTEIDNTKKKMAIKMHLVYNVMDKRKKQKNNDSLEAKFKDSMNIYNTKKY